MSEAHQPRRADRVKTDGEIALRRSFALRWPVRMTDFSPYGCRVELVERIPPSARLFVSLPGIETIMSSARWVDGFVAGVEFCRPLHPSVFEMLAARIGGNAANRPTD